jgi:hypothetical protein
MMADYHELMAKAKKMLPHQKRLFLEELGQDDHCPGVPSKRSRRTKPDGSGAEGSQPMPAIQHAGEPEKTWDYEYYGDQKMCDTTWIEILNHNDETVESGAFEFALETENLRGGKRKWEANTTDMKLMDMKTKKLHDLRKLEMRVLSPKDMLEAGSTTDIAAFQKDDVWTLRWQVEDNSGWKNMTEDVNNALLTELEAKNVHVEITHEWLHPGSQKWKETKYDVDLSLEQQTSREWQGTQRAVRLVAMREWQRHNSV